MSEPASVPFSHGEPSRDEMMSALFASMVMQQTQMAMLYLGQMPHPETGQPVHDFEAAQMFIDQLEMLEAKTKGNLSKEEAALLKQSLSSARLAFLQAVKKAETRRKSPPRKQSRRSQRLRLWKRSPKLERPQRQGLKALRRLSNNRKKFVKKY